MLIEFLIAAGSSGLAKPRISAPGTLTLGIVGAEKGPTGHHPSLILRAIVFRTGSAGVQVDLPYRFPNREFKAHFLILFPHPAKKTPHRHKWAEIFWAREE